MELDPEDSEDDFDPTALGEDDSDDDDDDFDPSALGGGDDDEEEDSDDDGDFDPAAVAVVAANDGDDDKKEGTESTSVLAKRSRDDNDDDDEEEEEEGSPHKKQRISLSSLMEGDFEDDDEDDDDFDAEEDGDVTSDDKEDIDEEEDEEEDEEDTLESTTKKAKAGAGTLTNKVKRANKEAETVILCKKCGAECGKGVQDVGCTSEKCGIFEVCEGCGGDINCHRENLHIQTKDEDHDGDLCYCVDCCQDKSEEMVNAGWKCDECDDSD